MAHENGGGIISAVADGCADTPAGLEGGLRAAGRLQGGGGRGTGGRCRCDDCGAGCRRCRRTRDLWWRLYFSRCGRGHYFLHGHSLPRAVFKDALPPVSLALGSLVYRLRRGGFSRGFGCGLGRIERCGRPSTSSASRRRHAYKARVASARATVVGQLILRRRGGGAALNRPSALLPDRKAETLAAPVLQDKWSRVGRPPGRCTNDSPGPAPVSRGNIADDDVLPNTPLWRLWALGQWARTCRPCW